MIADRDFLETNPTKLMVRMVGPSPRLRSGTVSVNLPLASVVAPREVPFRRMVTPGRLSPVVVVTMPVMEIPVEDAVADAVCARAGLRQST